MALQTQLNFPVKKSNRGSLKKNVDSPKLSVKRDLFEKVSPKSKKAKQDENTQENAYCLKTKKKVQSSASFITAKQVFHTGQPSRLIGRSEEVSKIEHFIYEHVKNHQAGSMYISGAPGTGKTSCLMSVIKNWEKEISYAFVNCMSVNNPADIYTSIAREFKLPSPVLSSKHIVRSLEKFIMESKSMNVLILDEIDHLDSKGQEVLYHLFQWPQIPKSSLILIGIANALDLTDRLLPRLHAFNYEPKLMHFQPYTREEIVQILEDRLSSVQKTIIKPLAIQLCARKIAACTGDIRKALDVCRRAIEIVENKKDEFTLQSTSDDRCNPGSPMKSSIGKCVDVSDINAVLHEVYGSRLQTSANSKIVTMPLQQMIILCTLILIKKHGKVQDMNLGKLYDVYKRVCKKKDICAVSEWEFNGLCNLIETRGLISLKPAKALRLTKVVLKIDETEAEYLLQDKALLPSILSDRSVLNKN